LAAARPPGRRRSQVSGRYFALSWERPQAVAATSVDTPAAAPARPMIAVAKKLVPSSPLRNAIRRVVREAARARPEPPPPALLVRLVALPTLDAVAPAASPVARPLPRRPRCAPGRPRRAARSGPSTAG
jgi:RNase P protein component